jgi:acyl-CoA synthetase (AMP-forming)/AMP-acid ligase II
VLAAARHAPARPALVDADSGQVVSFATLAARVDRVAAALAAGGFAPGAVLALDAPNVPPWAGVALGAMRAGGAVTGSGPARRRATSAASWRSRARACS